MTTPLPNPLALPAFLNDLERMLWFLESNYQKQIVVERASADQKVRARADGSGTLRSMAIDASLLVAPNLTTLGTALRSVINDALLAATQQVAAKLSHEAFGFSVPGLPATGQPAPDFAGFSRTADAVFSKVLAASVCDSSRLFEYRQGPVGAVVNATRQVASLSFQSPLVVSAPHLEQLVRDAVNGAIELATRRDTDSAGVVRSILDASAAFQDLVLYASDELRVDAGASLRNSAGDGFGMVGSAGATQTVVGAGAELGNVLSVAGVTVQAGAHVHGALRTSGQLSAAGADITGPTVQDAVVVLPELSLNVVFPGSAAAAVIVASDTQRTIAPGYYSDLVVRARGKLVLSSGVYFCNSLVLEAQAQVSLNAAAGPIFLYVRDSFTFQGAFVDAGGGVPNVFVGYLGAATASVAAPFSGTLSAPNAKVDVQATGATDHVGAFHARQIEVHPNARIRHLPFGVIYENLPNLAAPPALAAAAVHLGFEDSSGWTSPQAQLASVTTPVNQGTRSLRVANITGSTEIIGSLFSTAGVGASVTRLRLDLWVSTTQPTPSAVGEVQLFATIPGANVYGAFVGVVDLTPLSRGVWSLIDLELPPTTRDAIRAHRNTQLKIVLNVTSGSGPYFLDNIRFA